MYMYIHVEPRAHAHGVQRGRYVFSSFFPPYCLETGSPSEPEALGTPARLAGQGVPDACLSLAPSAGGPGMHSQGQLLCGCWGLKLRSPCLQCKATTSERSP